MTENSWLFHDNSVINMSIYETGIIYSGILLVNKKSSDWFKMLGESKQDHLVYSFISAIQLLYNECYAQKLQTIVGENMCMTFYTDELLLPALEDKHSRKTSKNDTLMAYAVLENRKNFEQWIRKRIHPKLKRMVSIFKYTYAEKNYCEISQFRGFKTTMESIFGKF